MSEVAKYACLYPIRGVLSVKMHPTQAALVLICNRQLVKRQLDVTGVLVSSCRMGMAIFILEVQMN